LNSPVCSPFSSRGNPSGSHCGISAGGHRIGAAARRAENKWRPAKNHICALHGIVHRRTTAGDRHGGAKPWRAGYRTASVGKHIFGWRCGGGRRLPSWNIARPELSALGAVPEGRCPMAGACGMGFAPRRPRGARRPTRHQLNLGGGWLPLRVLPKQFLTRGPAASHPRRSRLGLIEALLRLTLER
jgi:hypothetical protein